MQVICILLCDASGLSAPPGFTPGLNTLLYNDKKSSHPSGRLDFWMSGHKSFEVFCNFTLMASIV